MQKIALITRHSSPDWVSCRHILANLQKSYQLLTNFNFKNFHFDAQDSLYRGRRVALDTARWQADKVIFLDHFPHPGPIFKFWQEETPEYQPEVYIHVYGDFSLNAGQWVDCEQSLAKLPVHFFCASDKQAQIIKRFTTTSNVEVVPFPVDKSIYYFDSSVREQTRKNLGLQSETLFFYSGRLSLQKNIIQLLRSFELYQRVLDSQALLYLAGPVDDLGNPYLGKQSPPGLMNYDLQTLLHDLFPGERRNSIRYFNSLPSDQLNKLYNAADVFISLSTHHDEDYGMAPAEALMTGCPSILTNWGGYSGFKNYAPELVQLAPVYLHSSSVLPKEVEVMKLMGQAAQKNRNKKSDAFLEKICIESVSKQLDLLLRKKIQAQPFLFTPLLRRLAQSFGTDPLAPLSFGKTYSSLYKEIYADYRN